MTPALIPRAAKYRLQDPSTFSRNLVLHIRQVCLFLVSLSPPTSGLQLSINSDQANVA